MNKKDKGAEMIKCKCCGEEIAKSAKTCPHCGAKLKTKKVLWIVLAVIAVFIIIVAAFGGSDEPEKVGEVTQPPATTSPSETPEPGPFTVGDKVELNGIIVTLVKVSENNGGNYMTPADGKVFVVCEFEIENNSSKDIAVSSLLSFNAYVDDYTTALSLSATLSTDKTQLDGTIAAGKKMNGVVGYEADKGWSEIEIRFTPDFWAGKDIIFAYSK